MPSLAQNWKKMHFFDNSRTTAQDGNMETRQMTPLFIYFCRFNCFYIHLRIWKYSKLIFKGNFLWPILVCKISQFLTKSYRFGTFIILFKKVVTLRLLNILPIPRSQIPNYFRLWLMDYMLQQRAIADIETLFL